MAKHLKFIARTVMVQEGNVEGAYRTLNRVSCILGWPCVTLELMPSHLPALQVCTTLQACTTTGLRGSGDQTRILTTDGLTEVIKRRRYYEKPCRRRQRESYETCRRIYNMEMARKINFLMRKNRADPWLGC
ncbi:small ribosomal subunit protein bS21m isoform X1 [Arvicanthis niloticus]|uniref:small ribosomal subunit protein bS21m isoform X1 n=1 Tax=Arvicanthis niloticus TaxID=61156 RepID=UPI00402BDBEE